MVKRKYQNGKRIEYRSLGDCFHDPDVKWSPFAKVMWGAVLIAVLVCFIIALARGA